MSLVTTPRAALATCAACGETKVTEISLTLTDGTYVDFSSCHSCERKSWMAGDIELPLASVLEKSRKIR